MGIDNVEELYKQGRNTQVVVTGYDKSVGGTITLTVGGTYSAADYVGPSGTVTAFNGCARYNGGSGRVIAATLIDKDKQAKAAEIWIFCDVVTPPDDNAAWTLTGAEMEKLVAIIPLSTYYSGAANSIASGIPVAPRAFQCADDSTALYPFIVTRDAPVYAADPYIILDILQN
jgi:hypothetical protein